MFIGVELIRIQKEIPHAILLRIDGCQFSINQIHFSRFSNREKGIKNRVIINWRIIDFNNNAIQVDIPKLEELLGGARNRKHKKETNDNIFWKYWWRIKTID